MGRDVLVGNIAGDYRGLATLSAAATDCAIAVTTGLAAKRFAEFHYWNERQFAYSG